MSPGRPNRANSCACRRHRLLILGQSLVVGLMMMHAATVQCQAFQDTAPAAQAQQATEDAEVKTFFDERLPLIEREPYDEIQLDEFNQNSVIRILPLRNPPPDPLPEQGILIFEAPDLSENVLQVPFENVVDYRTYNELLVADANRLIAQQEYARAYRNLLYVYDHGGRTNPALEQAIQNCLFQDGRLNYENGNFDLAISIFEEVYKRDPEFTIPGFDKNPIQIILESLEANIGQKFASGQYDSVRAMLMQIGNQYGSEALPIIDRWNRLLGQKSNELIAQARSLMDGDQGKEAHLVARQANRVIPNRPEALALYADVVQRFPIIFVGVTNGPDGADPLRLDLWGGRRVGRLTMRAVIEFSGLSDEGGRYEFLNGSLEQSDEYGLEYRFQIDPKKYDSGIPPITTQELARRLLSMGTVGMLDYRTSFAKIIDTVEIVDEFTVLIKLRRQFVRPEALIQFPYEDSAEGPEMQNGHYVLSSGNEQISVYNRNSDYPSLEGQQHPEIVEWRFPNPSEAIDAIIDGEVDVIDRVPLADLPRLQLNAEIEVRPYLVPTVHMLIPNQRNEFTQDPSFRNGLLRGIDRELILEEMICGGNEIDGCEVLSGPFPIGTEENDQLAYGYNMSVRAQPYNDKLGMVLVQTTRQKMIDAMIEAGTANPVVDIPPLVLCHTRDDIPRIACAAIAGMWTQLGVPVELRQLEPGQTIPPDDEWDFLYYEMSMQEPLVDADKLFGAEGLVKSLSAPVQQSIRRLGYADSWRVAGTTLRRMHRQVRNDVSLLPLWQLKEHYAYRDNVREVGRNLIHLYQNVDYWRIVPRAMNDE